VSSSDVDWHQRVKEPGISPFGLSALGELYNRGLFWAKARALASALRSEHLPPPERRRCLDAGIGHGWLLRTWKREGVRALEGLELVPEVAHRIRQSVPEARIRVVDLASWEPYRSESYDLVCALDVLFYLCDDSSFAGALASLASVVCPGGLLVVSDLLGRPVAPSAGHRPWLSYARILHPLGFRCRRRRSIFVLGNLHPLKPRPELPAGAKYPLGFNVMWNLAHARSPLARIPETLAVVGLYGLDALILSQGGCWKSQEIAVWKREGGAPCSLDPGMRDLSKMGPPA